MRRGRSLNDRASTKRTGPRRIQPGQVLACDAPPRYIRQEYATIPAINRADHQGVARHQEYRAQPPRSVEIDEDIIPSIERSSERTSHSPRQRCASALGNAPFLESTVGTCRALSRLHPGPSPLPRALKRVTVRLGSPQKVESTRTTFSAEGFPPAPPTRCYMPAAALPVNEEERVSRLLELQVLDSAPEAELSLIHI